MSNVLEDAIATTKGWVHSKTGELLVSIRGLSGAVEWTKELVADLQAGKDAVVELVEDVKEEVEEAVAELKEIVADKDTKSKKKKATKAAE